MTTRLFARQEAAVTPGPAGRRLEAPGRRGRRRPRLRAAARLMAAGLLAGLLASAAGADTAGSAPGAAPPLPHYVILDLETLGPPGAVNSPSGFTPNAINASGAIAGYVSGWWNGNHAALCDFTGIHDLGALGPQHATNNYSSALGINDAGQVVGYSQMDDGNAIHLFLYSGGVLRDLTPGSGVQGTDAAINNAGAIVAVGATGSASVLWANGTTTDLGSFMPRAINDAGQIAGSLAGHAAIWQNGTIRDLGLLPGYGGCTVTGINATGQVVGGAYSPLQPGGSDLRAFFYDGSQMHDLGAPGGSYSDAEGINAAGQIVGRMSIAGDAATIHAFLYSGGTMIDLNDLLPANSGWVLGDARAINDAGQIVGVGFYNGVFQAFLLTFPDDPRVAPPAAPSGLSVRMASLTELDLTWSDNSSGENAFEVQATTANDDTDWRDVGMVPANTPVLACTGLPSYAHYHFRVRAVNLAGASAWSAEASGDTGLRALASVSYGPGLTFSYERGFDFGALRVGTPGSQQTVTVTNEGNGPLAISRIAVTGANASEFSLVATVPTPRTLAPGESFTLGLVFTPAGAGTRSAALTLTDNEPSGSSITRLSGTGLAPVLAFSASTLEFGPQPVGLSGDLALLLRVTGDASLTVSGLAIQGADASDFSLAPGGWSGGTLQPGDIILLNIRFNPTVTGRRTASLVFSGDDPAGPRTVTLAGTGTAPLLRASADSLIFALQAPGATQTVSFTNHGDAPLAIQSVALGGPDAGSFKIVSDTGEASLAPGASRTLTIRFNPATIAARRAHTTAARITGTGYSATLVIQDNDPHPTSPHQIALVALAPPAAPGNLTTTVTAGPQVVLNWTNPRPDPHAYLTIWRQEGTGSWTRVALLPGDATHFTDTNVSANASYTYQAHWVNGPVVSPWSNLAHASTTGAVLAPPSGLTATVGSGPQVRLTWSLSAPNPSAYLTLWRQAGSGEWTRVALLRGDARQFTDTSVQAGTIYSYHAHLVTDPAVSAWSNTATVSTPTAGPAQLTAAAGLGARVVLTWRNPRPDAHAWLTVWRQSGAGAWTRVALLHGDVASFTDTQVSAGTSYRYRAHRVDGADVSDWSNEATAVLP